jgi:hypothetical protein
MTMKAMELFDPTKDLRKLFSDNDVCHIRIQYANSLFFHRGNKVDQNVVTSFFDKVQSVCPSKHFLCLLSVMNIM